ncbi:MAG: hypothetical protein IPH12_01625 [Saprospirales bacterium]|nr:hypothetical protein [Saprospirales bacterium]
MPTVYHYGYWVLGEILVATMSLSGGTGNYSKGLLFSLDAGAHWLKINLPKNYYDGYYRVEKFGEHFYCGDFSTGNYRFPSRPVLQKLEEITPKVPVREPRLENRITISPNPAVSGETGSRPTPPSGCRSAGSCTTRKGGWYRKAKWTCRATGSGLGRRPKGCMRCTFRVWAAR